MSIWATESPSGGYERRAGSLGGGVDLEYENDGLEALNVLLRRAVDTYITGRNRLLDRLLSESVEAFIAARGVSEVAAQQVGPLARELGDRHARYGYDLDDLTASFCRAQKAAQRGLQFVMGAAATQDIGRLVRDEVDRFIDMLHREARGAGERVLAVRGMPAAERRRRLGLALTGPADLVRIELLARFSDIDLDVEYVVVVAVGDDLPELAGSSGALPGGLDRELLVPVGYVIKGWPGQVVVGPPAPLRAIAATVGPTRRAADLLRAGAITDSRRVVPCSDLLASLIVDGDPNLTELIMGKHLGKLDGLSAQQRLNSAELLLQWLERGVPLNQLARELGLPEQTAHSRMKRIRQIFGDALDDPTQRLELIVALHAAVPRWRAELDARR